ncbi:MAG: D-alanine--D-alanine ligase family protein [Oscillospiraceae bacterium]
MAHRQNTLILFGGVSNEYEVSLRSTCSILENLDLDRFEPVLCGITREGRWLLCEADTAAIRADVWQERGRPAFLSPDRSVAGVMVCENSGLRTLPIDVIFPAMHGQNCEDGALQGLLTLSGIPYVGCGVCASAVCFDKVFTHMAAERIGVPMARFEQVFRWEDSTTAQRRIAQKIGYPCFVKPVNSGSSVGCSPVHTPGELEAALQNAFQHDTRALVEELVLAQEVECAVLGNLQPIAPTTGEIVTPGGFYDYDSKYKNDCAQLCVPANIPVATQNEVRRLALLIYQALGCRGLARADFFVKSDGSVLFNEINTMPGFTSISMYPRMLLAAGLTYQDLISRLLELAIEEHPRAASKE